MSANDLGRRYIKLMCIQNNFVDRRLDVDLDLDDSMEAEITSELQVEDLDVIVDRSDAAIR